MGVFRLALALVLANVSTATAQTTELPTYAYDAIAEFTIATTAVSTCDRARVKDRNLQSAMAALMGRLAADGLDPTASIQHFETEKGQAQIALREANLRQRHGVAPTGADALCDAIRAELKTNRALAKLLRLR